MIVKEMLIRRRLHGTGEREIRNERRRGDMLLVAMTAWDEVTANE
jgi:hypothetical protein